MSRIRQSNPLVFAIFAVTATLFGSVRAVELVPGDLILTDRLADALVRTDPAFANSVQVGGGAVLDRPSDLAFTASGNLLVACAGADVVVEIDPDGALVRTLGAAAVVDEITGVAVAPRGHILLTSRTQDRVVELDADGVFVRDYGAADGLDEPRGVRVGADGHVFVASFITDRVMEFTARGVFLRELGGGTSLDGPDGLAFDGTGRLLVTSANTGTVFVFDGEGAFLQEFGAGASMVAPSGIAVRADGGVVVGDAGGELHLFDSGFVFQQSLSDLTTACGGVAFAPRRYKVSLKGQVVQGGATTAVSETAELAFDPGSAWSGLFLNAASSPVAAALDTTLVAASGRLIGKDSSAKKRSSHALSWTPRAAEDGVLSLDMEWKGSVNDARYVPTSGSGTLSASGAGFAMSVAVKVKKTLD